MLGVNFEDKHVNDKERDFLVSCGTFDRITMQEFSVIFMWFGLNIINFAQRRYGYIGLK